MCCNARWIYNPYHKERRVTVHKVSTKVSREPVCCFDKQHNKCRWERRRLVRKRGQDAIVARRWQSVTSGTWPRRSRGAPVVASLCCFSQPVSLHTSQSQVMSPLWLATLLLSVLAVQGNKQVWKFRKCIFKEIKLAAQLAVVAEGLYSLDLCVPVVSPELNLYCGELGIISVLWQEEGYTGKYSLSPREISPYIPTWVIMLILSMTIHSWALSPNIGVRPGSLISHHNMRGSQICTDLWARPLTYPRLLLSTSVLLCRVVTALTGGWVSGSLVSAYCADSHFVSTI